MEQNHFTNKDLLMFFNRQLCVILFSDNNIETSSLSEKSLFRDIVSFFLVNWLTISVLEKY